MIDVEVIDNCRFGILENGGKAHKLLKAVNSAIMLKRLSAEDGELRPLENKELQATTARAGMKVDSHALNTLYFYGLLNKEVQSHWNGHAFEIRIQWEVSAAGMEALRDLKEGADEIFMPLVA
jgi:hypothetical protein